MGRKKSFSKKTKRKYQKKFSNTRRKQSNPNYVYMICKKCKEKRCIKVNDESIYTDEVKKNYVCLLCK